MMLHMSKEEHELYDELDKTDDPKKSPSLGLSCTIFGPKRMIKISF